MQINTFTQLAHVPHHLKFLTRHMAWKLLTGAAVRVGVPGFLVKHQGSLWGNHLNEGGHLTAKQNRPVYHCRQFSDYGGERILKNSIVLLHKDFFLQVNESTSTSQITGRRSFTQVKVTSSLFKMYSVACFNHGTGVSCVVQKEHTGFMFRVCNNT